MRGKHARSAAVRRDVESQAQQIERLQRELARAIAERDESTQKADYWQQRHARDVRRLSDELEAGTSEALRTAYAALEAARERHAKLEDKLEEVKRMRDKEHEWFAARCLYDLGLGESEYCELSLQMLGHEVDVIDDTVLGNKQLRSKVDAASRIAAARGKRQSAERPKLSRVRLHWAN